MTDSLGTLLKEAREAKGLSIEQLSTMTKINFTFIEALENGRWDLLPGRVYLKPFAKICAEALGLDIKEIYDKIDSITPEEKRKLVAPPSEQIIITKKKIDYKLPIVLASVLLAMVLISLAVKARKSSTTVIRRENVVPARGFQRRGEPKWERPWERPPANPTLVGNQRLRLEARSDLWACVVADYDTVFEGNIAAGSGKTFVADNTFHLSLSRNDRAIAYLNGRKLDLVGADSRRLYNALITSPKKDEGGADEAK